MAKIVRDEYVTINPDGTVNANYSWQGVGIAYVPDCWRYLYWGWIEKDPVITLGNLILRVVGRERFPGGVYVVKDEMGWRLWAAWHCSWRFLRRLERNLRLTATVWGLLKCEIGAEPRWRDFVILRHLGKHKE